MKGNVGFFKERNTILLLVLLFLHIGSFIPKASFIYLFFHYSASVSEHLVVCTRHYAHEQMGWHMAYSVLKHSFLFQGYRQVHGLVRYHMMCAAGAGRHGSTECRGGVPNPDLGVREGFPEEA